MKLTTVVSIRGETTALLLMMQRFNAACNALSPIAYKERIFHWLPLQRRTYHWLRQDFGLTSAQTVVAIRKVAYAYSDRRRRDRLAMFKPLGAVPLYKHSYKRDCTVSIYGLRIPFDVRPGVILSGKRQARLIYRQGRFFIHQVIEQVEPKALPTSDFLGCDLGIVNLLVDSDGETYSGAQVDDMRRRYSHRRRNLQRKRTHAAKRKLQRISGKQALYQRDANHIISKHVVTKAKDTLRGIALEDLGGIGQRITVRRRQRARHANWAFHQLRAFVEYKAVLAGVPITLVNPRGTSRTCPACGHSEKANRPSQSHFLCVSCGFAGLADAIAARNIRARALDDEPMVAASASDKSRALMG